MMRKIYFLMIILSMMIVSCSERVMEAMETHKMHDRYFILRKNGHYSFKTLVMGVYRLPDGERGRYILSNDTVYFVDKKTKNTFSMYGYGIIDSVAGTFNYKYNDSLEWNMMELREMPTRRRDKQMGY